MHLAQRWLPGHKWPRQATPLPNVDTRERVHASCCGPQHVSAVLGRIWKAAAVSAAPCGTGQLRRSDSTSLDACTATLPAAVESAQYIRLRTSVLPWLQPGRWGAAPHWVSAAFYHLSTILRVRGRISNPLVLHPTPPLIASERACLKPLHPDCMGCMSSR